MGSSHSLWRCLDCRAKKDMVNLRSTIPQIQLDIENAWFARCHGVHDAMSSIMAAA